MSPKIIIGVLLGVLIAGVFYLFEEEWFATLSDPHTHVDMAQSLGITKGGKPRPRD